MTIKPHISVLLILLTCSLLLLLSGGSLAMAGTEGSDGNRVRDGWMRSVEAIPEVLLLSLNCSILLRKEAGDLEFMPPASNSLCILTLDRTGIMSQTNWK